MERETQMLLERIKNDAKEGGVFEGENPKRVCSFRYIEALEKCRSEKISENMKMGTGTEEAGLAAHIVQEMRKYEVNFEEVRIILGYITKLFKIGDVYRSGIDIEEFYINECLRKELIDLSKDLVNYIETQEEIYANIPMVINYVYISLKERTNKIKLW